MEMGLKKNVSSTLDSRCIKKINLNIIDFGIIVGSTSIKPTLYSYVHQVVLYLKLARLDSSDSVIYCPVFLRDITCSLDFFLLFIF